jgi:transglutaminase-like putative cysteine protease
MILEIQHETRLRYTRPATEWIAEFRVEPVSDADQSCASFDLTFTPKAEPGKYFDGFGNRVHHVNLLAPGQEVRALAAAVVETHPRDPDLARSTATIAQTAASRPLETIDYLRFGGPVRSSEKLASLFAELAPAPDRPAAAFVRRVASVIHERFEYAKAVTSATSPIDDVLSLGQGVCQDFAHLMIGLLRLAQVPARYVSGYIHRPGKESQSHAWVESWIADRGWVGIDPTNDTLIGESFVKVAVGRDFTDVQPNRGVYRGTGEEQIHARVQTRKLDRLPTMSWRDQLPKLDSPLVEILPQLSRADLDDDELAAEASQQQQ